MKTPSLLPLLLLLGLTLSAPAAVLPVGNASFESPAQAVNAYTYNLGTSWFRNGGTTTGAFIERIAGFAAEGANHLGMEQGQNVSQLISTVLEPNTVYTLTVAVGNRSGYTAAGNQSIYSIGVIGIGADFSNRRADASTLAAAGQFVDAPPVSLNTVLHPEVVGHGVYIELYAGGNGRSHFDNIRLETTTPILVTNNENSGPGSLRRAMDDAATGDTILFDPTVFNGEAQDTIVLATELAMTGAKSLTIDATNISGGVTISGNDVTRCFLRSGTGTLTLRGMTITKGSAVDGGCVYVGSATAELRMENCTVSNGVAANSAGGLSTGGKVTLINCTVTGNRADQFGGGINLNGGTASAVLINCTVTGNTAGPQGIGGISNQGGTLTLENCLVAGNGAPSNPDLDNRGPLTRAGRNFIGDNSGSASDFPAGNPNANGDRAGTAAAPLDPLLSAATFNGGTGVTRLPLPGSPVINNGVATPNSPATDQRGAVRPQGAAPDIGAVEVEWGGNVTTAPPQLTGLWLFDKSANLMQASVGIDLAVAGTAPGWSTNQVDNDQRLLSGVITTVAGTANRLVATHGIAPNGGTYVNRYTILMDILSPAGSRSSWRSIFQTNTANTNDADYHIASDDTVGVAAIGYGPAIDESRWQRLVITVENGSSPRTYVNGTLFHVHSIAGVDGRHSLDPQVLFFADGSGANAPLYVGAIAMWNGALSPADVAALGGPGGPIPPDGQITTPVDKAAALPFADSPNGEDAARALDDYYGTKYLNFQKLNTGLEIVPALGVTRLTGLRLTSANDVPDRDPATFTVLGRSGDRPWLPIAAGVVPAFTGRFATQEFRFTSATPACDRYQVLFPTVANAVFAFAMQIAEVDLLGAPVDRTPRITKLAHRGVADNQRQFTVVWAAEPYATYGLLSSPNLQLPWTLVTTNMQNSNSAGYQVFTSHVDNARWFFRVLRER